MGNDIESAQRAEKRTLIRSFALFVHRNCIRPHSDVEDVRRKELILNILLVSTIVLSTTLFAIATYDSIIIEDYSGVFPLALFVWVALFVALLSISRMGYVQISSYGLIILFLLPVLYTMIRYGAVIPELVLMSALLIVIASILIGTRFSFFLAAYLGLGIVLIHYAHIVNLIIPISEWRNSEWSVIADAVPLAATLFVIAIVSWLSNREIEKSLRRARTSEAELKLERDSLEQKVEERTRELKQAQMEQMAQLYRFAEFGKMSSGYFHDIANPLTAVSLSLEQMKEGGYQKLSDARVHFERALGATKRMEAYISAVRKQIQQREELEDFSPSEEVRQLIDIFGYKARKACVVIRSRLDAQVRLFGNTLKFNQVVMNLVNNAIDSYEGAGVPKEDREVVIILRKEDAYVELTVKDYGAGIRREDLNRIFEPFFTTKSAREGIGIGLATVKDIVKKDFVGSLRVESKLGKGSEFTVFFPLNVAHSATEEYGTTDR